MDSLKLEIENRIGTLFDSENEDQTIALATSSLMNTLHTIITCHSS